MAEAVYTGMASLQRFNLKSIYNSDWNILPCPAPQREITRIMQNETPRIVRFWDVANQRPSLSISPPQEWVLLQLWIEETYEFKYIPIAMQTNSPSKLVSHCINDATFRNTAAVKTNGRVPIFIKCL